MGRFIAYRPILLALLLVFGLSKDLKAQRINFSVFAGEGML